MDIVGENGIIFFRGGGHSHDGDNSSPVDTTSYSIFDFNLGIQTNNEDTNREYSRSINQQTFNQYVKTFISSQVLEPAGIILGENSIRGLYIGADEINATHIAANTITANEIAANTITGDKIAAGTIDATKVGAEFIIVGDTISSNNYVPASIGWSINSAGTADFRSATIGGWTVNTSAIFAANTVLYSNGKTNLVNPTVTTGTYTGGTWSGGTLGGITVGTSQLSVGFSEFSNSFNVSNSTGFGVYINPSNLQIDFRTATATVVGNIKGLTSVALGFPGLSFTGTSVKFASTYFSVFPTTGNTQVYLYPPSSTTSGTPYQEESGGRLIKFTSLRQLKYDILPVSNSLEKVKLLNPVNYKWRPSSQASELEKFLKDNDIKTGFIAEEVESIDKGLVSYSYLGNKELPRDEWFEDETNFGLSVYDSNAILSIAVAAIKELIAKIELLESRMGD
jgi:hypothetical protein